MHGNYKIDQVQVNLVLTLQAIKFGFEPSYITATSLNLSLQVWLIAKSHNNEKSEFRPIMADYITKATKA